MFLAPILFTLGLIAACVAFIYIQNEKAEAPFRYQEESLDADQPAAPKLYEDLPGELKYFSLLD